MTQEQKKTLLKWRARYKRAQLAHSYTAISYGRYSMALGVLLIILTTASCVLIFAKNVQPDWLSPVVGISAALFAYLQTFLQLSEKADAQRAVARRYGALKKQIEFIIDFQLNDANLDIKVDDLRKKEDEIATEAPHALSHRWKEAKKETQTENDEVSMRKRT
ncbi:SLATT domain-containing protein [Photobacterium toruni]|uniref:SLATT domain-containing protein n=1 Tax=Photobacterium toruni TaxID=1935446 RepID=UPI00210F35B3|nr:SLATT domain-containing protein [Photobacterium toruni]